MFERPRGRKVREREISLETPEPRHRTRVPAGDAPEEERSADEHGGRENVKSKTKAFEEKADSTDRRETESEHNSARACAKEPDAFGKCVSKMARSQ
jgi:hypothetical protein